MTDGFDRMETDRELQDLDRALPHVWRTVEPAAGLTDRLYRASVGYLVCGPRVVRSESAVSREGPIALPQRGRSPAVLYATLAAAVALAVGLGIRYGVQSNRNGRLVGTVVQAPPPAARTELADVRDGTNDPVDELRRSTWAFDDWREMVIAYFTPDPMVEDDRFSIEAGTVWSRLGQSQRDTWPQAEGESGIEMLTSDLEARTSSLEAGIDDF